MEVPDAQTSKPQADRQAAQEPEPEAVRPAEAAEVSARHKGSSRKRKGSGDAAVQAGPDQQVDEGSYSRRGKPATEAIEIVLGGPTAYTDYPDIPEHLATSFKIHVLPPKSKAAILHPSVDASVYEGDMVSDTIRKLEVWEPPDTIVHLSAFKAAPPGTLFVDIGCHVGWYSLLALGHYLDVLAIDGDDRMLHALALSKEENRYYESSLTLRQQMVGKGFAVVSEADNLIVKIDVEGAEIYAVDALWPLIEERKVSHLTMEVSPVFEDYYPDLLTKIIDCGYMAYAMPPKTYRPPVIESEGEFGVKWWVQHYGQNLHLLHPRSRNDWVSRQHQFDAVMFTEEAAWA